MPPADAIRPQRSTWDLVQPALDAVCILASLYIVQRLAVGEIDEVAIGAALAAAVIFPLAGQVAGLWHNGFGGSTDREILSIAGTWLLTILVLALLGFLTRYANQLPRSVLLGWAVLAPSLIALIRMGTRIVQRDLQRRGLGVRRVAIAGMNELGLQVAENIRRDAGLGFSLIGFFDDRSPERLAAFTAREELRCHAFSSPSETAAFRQPASPDPLRGDLNQLVEQARKGDIDIVMLTLPMRAESRIKFVLDQLSDSTASVYLVPDFFVFELLHSRWASVGGLPAVSVYESPMYGVDGYVKRVADILLTLAGLTLAALPMMVIAVAVKWSSPGPVFFRQRRYGLDGREIRVWKFRSMRTCDDGPVVLQATKDDPRITRVGALLRKTSLDELPQLFNVLDGSMSLVGPRPHATAHNEQYRGLIHGYMLRHKVKPGITGLAQVSGCRGETETLDKMQRRVEFDHQYIRQWSVWLDIKILAKTLQIAWRQDEAY